MRRNLGTFIAAGFSLTLVAASPVAADDDADTAAALKALDDALPGTLINNPFVVNWRTNGEDVSSKVVKADVPGENATQFRVKKKPNEVWDANLRDTLDRRVESGETIAIYFWARAEQAASGKDVGDIDVIIGRKVDPWDPIISQQVTPDAEWRLYNYSGKAARDFPQNEIEFGFNFGRAEQTVEIGQVYIVSLGKS